MKNCQAHATTNPWGLSPKQAAVMRLMVAGQGSAEVAKDLGISIKTVQAYIARIKDRMGVKSALQAALMWDRLFRGPEIKPTPTPRPPSKRDLQLERLRQAIRGDLESRKDRGNRILIANLSKRMPHWTPPMEKELA